MRSRKGRGIFANGGLMASRDPEAPAGAANPVVGVISMDLTGIVATAVREA